MNHWSWSDTSSTVSHSMGAMVAPASASSASVSSGTVVAPAMVGTIPKAAIPAPNAAARRFICLVMWVLPRG